MTAKRTEPYPPLTADRLRELLNYNPETGEFTWLVHRNGRGGASVVGAVAGTLAHDGYVRIMIERRLYVAHRLAFLWMTGEWPATQVDHIDRNRANNAWSNLREATLLQNMANIGRRAKKSGLPQGVFMDAQGKIYSKFGGTRTPRYKYLGQFETPEEASAAYEAHRANMLLTGAP